MESPEQVQSSDIVKPKLLLRMKLQVIIIRAPLFTMRVWMFYALILIGAQQLVLACRPAATSISEPVLLITGDRDNPNTALTSVEVLTPSGVPLLCTVPPLPASRYDHTQPRTGWWHVEDMALLPSSPAASP